MNVYEIKLDSLIWVNIFVFEEWNSFVLCVFEVL